MSESLVRLVRQIDHTTVVETQYDEVASWPKGELDRYLAAGLLSPAEPAHSLVCEECGELEEVILLDSIVTPPFAPFLRCGKAGPYRVAMERLQRWQMSVLQLVDALFRHVPLIGSREEVVRHRIWRLGKVRWAGVFWQVYFGRALQRRDAWHAINQAAFPARSVLFVPSKAYQADVRILKMPVVIGLDTVISWNGEALAFDQAQVEQQLALELAASQMTPTSKPLPKRATRTALIEQLRRELEEHLRSARDYAQVTQDRTGTPELLPRPTMEFLAKRLGVNKSTISRCFEDESGGDLRFMWEMAADVDRIVGATNVSGS
jgi:AraC-like DNA-binding protein